MAFRLEVVVLGGIVSFKDGKGAVFALVAVPTAN